MRILLLGKNGQLGWELQRALAPLGEITSLDYPEIDLTKLHTVCPAIREIRPAVVINATAYTQVDRAESEPHIPQIINGTAPGELAHCSATIGAAFIHFSTDYVFNGEKGQDYVESDSPSPLNVYGESKLAGERAVAAVGGAYLVLRTSWVYSLRRDSFVSKVLEWSRRNPDLRVVEDQVSNPTWARMLAETTAQLLAKGGDHIQGWMHERRGLYHLAGDGSASRLEWAKAILDLDPRREEQVCRAISPARTCEFPSPAARPLHSALNCDRFVSTFGLRLPHWREALKMAMDQG
jgi:dTDP-4-dehydrorhamnose reductase